MTTPENLHQTWIAGRKRLWLLLVGCLACSSSTGPDLALVNGAYTLELVDGSPLPVAFETGTCPREIYVGTMDLTPHVAEQPPLYTVQVFLRSQCDPATTLPIDRVEAVRDFGGWSTRSDAVWFDSDRRGSYLAPIEQVPTTEQGPLLTLQFDGRSYTFRRTWIYQPGGHPG